MTTPARRASFLCGALVGGCSALISVLAHSAAGGAAPRGAAVAMLTLVCATVGAATSARLIKARRAWVLALVAGLAVGQALGHVVMTLAASHHHGSHGVLPSAPMLAAHAAAAVALGLLISLVGHLYLVCATVLAWLSLLLVHRGRPTAPPWGAHPIVLPSRLLCAGRRMRAPPVVPLGA